MKGAHNVGTVTGVEPLQTLEPLRAGAVLFAKDVAKVATFYREVFSLDVHASEATYVLLGSEFFSLTVHAIPAEVAAEITIANPAERHEDAAIKLVLPVASITEGMPCLTKL